MSVYGKGLVMTRTDLVPTLLEPYAVRLAMARQGAMDWNRGASRFYGRGMDISVGATSVGPVGVAADWLVKLLLDLLHIGLLLAGFMTLYKALFP